MWSGWGCELPLWEASLELDPPEPERIDNAAWQIARAAKTRGTIYKSEFEGTERQKQQVEQQSPQEMKAEAEKIGKTWPHNKEKRKSVTR